jgi:uncharacterized protein YbjT (DUF2867 family)
MRIAVVGGTGTIGRRIVAAVSRDGHEVRALSRSSVQYRVDLTTGAGLEAALVGCDVVIDASNGPPSLGSLLSATGRRYVLPAARAQFQPVDVDEAAVAVAAVATGAPRLARVTVAGPEVHDLRSLGRLWREGTGRRGIEIPIPLPGKLGRALREGRLTCANPDVRGTQTFTAWLQVNTP